MRGGDGKGSSSIPALHLSENYIRKSWQLEIKQSYDFKMFYVVKKYFCYK